MYAKSWGWASAEEVAGHHHRFGDRTDGHCAHTIELEYEGYPYPDVEPWLNLDRKRRVEAGDARRRRRGPPGPTTVVVLASRRFARHRVRQHVLIISGTMSRFSRARSQVLSSRGFAEATWLPDLWAGQCAGLPDHPCSRTYSLPTRKHASAGVAMGVFEDDATYLGTEPQIDARGTIAEPDSQA